jgi:hypothetical protein
MRREDGDFVTTRLETDGGIDDQSFGTTNPQVWMEEDDALLLCHC